MRIQCPNCFEYYEDGIKVCPRCGYAQGVYMQETLHMRMGSILQKRYCIGGVLSCSSFDVFYLAWDMMLKIKVVIREYLPREYSIRPSGIKELRIINESKVQQFQDGLERFAAEAKHLAMFRSEPEIADIFDGFMENNTAYIVMEYLEGKTLKKYLEQKETLEPELAIGLLTAVIRLLELVYKKNTPQWDIAPENIIVTEKGGIKLVRLQKGHRMRSVPIEAPGGNDAE